VEISRWGRLIKFKTGEAGVRFLHARDALRLGSTKVDPFAVAHRRWDLRLGET
jgi:hypothetical protein